jgi:hypothetical protein
MDAAEFVRPGAVKVRVDRPQGGRGPGEPELMGAKDAAAALGVRQSNLRTVAGLPEPYGTVAATTLWRADEIRALARRRTKEQADRAAAAKIAEKEKEEAA